MCHIFPSAMQELGWEGIMVVLDNYSRNSARYWTSSSRSWTSYVRPSNGHTCKMVEPSTGSFRWDADFVALVYPPTKHFLSHIWFTFSVSIGTTSGKLKFLVMKNCITISTSSQKKGLSAWIIVNIFQWAWILN